MQNEGQGIYGADGTGYNLWSSGLEMRTETLDANGAVLAATERDWTQRTAVTYTTSYPQYQPENDNRITDTRRILDDLSTARTHTDYDNTTANSLRANNPTDVYEYDFDGTLKRHTQTSYVPDATYTAGTVGSPHLLRLPVTRTVFDGSGSQNASTTYEYDGYNPSDQKHASLASYGTVVGYATPSYGSTLGNPTKIQQAITTSTSINTYPHYDVLGNVVGTLDPRGDLTTISFADNFGDGSNPAAGAAGSNGPTYALPTLITSPPPTQGAAQQTARSEYDFSTGLLTGFMDRNGIITQTLYNDAFDRPSEIKAALGAATEAHTHMYYAPNSGPAPVGALANEDTATAHDQSFVDDGAVLSWKRTDGFGRVTYSFTNAPEHPVETDTAYDALSRAIQVSNPYRNGYTPPGGSPESPQFTTTSYDLAGRIVTVTATDGAITSTAFTGPRTTATDAAGNQRASVVDGLGRLVKVFEDPNTGADNFETDYGYDALDDLTGVTQVGKGTMSVARGFGYDELKRMTSASNPESGAVGYQYDGNGNLTLRTDANGIQTVYAYDALNRVQSRTYTNLPASVGPSANVSYSYDPATPNGTGRLGSVSVAAAGASPASSSSHDRYDEFGRVLQSTQTTAGTAYPMKYSYDLAGEMLTETYPSQQRVVNTQYDSAGRISSLASGSTTYLHGFQYEAYGALNQVTLGDNMVATTTHNIRMQTSEIQLGPGGGGSTLDLKYTYNSKQGGSNNNGNLLEQTIAIGGPVIADQKYTYDSLNRLSSATEMNGTATVWSQAYQYDQFGNMAVTSSTNVPLPPTTPQAISAFYPGGQQTGQTKNQIVAAKYDPAGNLTMDFASGSVGTNNVYTYDAENRLTNFDTNVGTYSYDGDGHRVSKTTSAGTVYFVYDIAGKLIAEYGGQTVNGGTSYLTADQLGSTRVVTNSNGVIARHDYLPFGGEIAAATGGSASGRSGPGGYGATDDTRQRFTSKERDIDSELDYYDARYCSPAQGRFLSADQPFADQERAEPQSWNLYTYVRNRPLIYTDPNGLAHTDPNGVWVGDTDGEYDPEQNQYWHADTQSWGDKQNSDPWVSIDAHCPCLITKTQGDWGDYIRQNQRADGGVPDPYQSVLSRWLFGRRWIDPNYLATDAYQWGPNFPADDPPFPNPGKGPIPDVEPNNLDEKLALEEARANPKNAEQIIDKLGDEPRLVANYGPGRWVKMKWTHRAMDGSTKTVHWFRNLDTGLNVEFKFK